VLAKTLTKLRIMDTSILTQDQVAALVRSPEQYPIHFDAAWQWAGYSNKANALRNLKSSFEETVDFSSTVMKNPQAGRPSISYALTNDCFKMFCMMAGTDKGKEVRRYYLECERLLKDGGNPSPSQTIDWAAFAEIRRQIESTPDGTLKQMLEKTAADLLGQDYFAISSHAATLQAISPRKHRSKQPIEKPTKFDHIKDFVEHGAYVVVTDNPEDFVASATLYETYKEYLADYPVLPDNGDHACENINALSKRLSTYLGRSAIQKKVRGKNIRCYPGLLVR
jgi:phage anti-repressor protein